MKQLTDSDFELHFSKLSRFSRIGTTASPERNAVGENSVTSVRAGRPAKKTAKLTPAQEIRVADERYEILARATNDAVWDWDIVNDRIVWNHGLSTIFHYPPNLLHTSGRWWRERVHPDDRQGLRDRLEKTVGSKLVHLSANYRFRTADNNYKFVFDRAYVIYNDGKPVRIIGAMQDIDALMDATDQISKLSMVASKTNNVVIITNTSTKIEWVNEAFTRVTGYTIDEVIGRPPSEVLRGPGTDLSVIQHIHNKLERLESVDAEILYYSKAGKKIWFKLNINPVLNDQGTLLNYVSVHTDVTPLKDYEGRITAIAREQSQLIETANAIIFGVDQYGRIYEWNKLTEELTGYTRAEVMGRNIFTFFGQRAHPDYVKFILSNVLDGTPLNRYEFSVTDKHGKELTLLLSAMPRRSDEGQITGLLAVGQDITELTQYRQALERKVRERTQELEKSLEKERDLANLKSRFAAMVSHEFRTPLSTILFSAKHIKRYKARLTGEEIDAKVTMVEQQVKHMMHLLEDVLTLEKTNAPAVRAQKRKTNLSDLISRMITEVESAYNHSHTIRLEWSVSHTEVETDDGLLRNIVTNLLTNSVKFSSDSPFIYLKVEGSKHMLTITIRDEGIGMSPEDLDKIFVPFYRGTNSEAIPGTGLGLPIVKKAVDALDGIIEAQSQLGLGSTFIVKIPMETQSCEKTSC